MRFYLSLSSLICAVLVACSDSLCNHFHPLSLSQLPRLQKSSLFSQSIPTSRENLNYQQYNKALPKLLLSESLPSWLLNDDESLPSWFYGEGPPKWLTEEGFYPPAWMLEDSIPHVITDSYGSEG